MAWHIIQESWATPKMTARMRRMYGCPEKFRESLNTPTATFPEIFDGLLSWSIPRMHLQNLKFIVLPVPEIMWGTFKNWAVPGYAHTPFSAKFLWASARMVCMNVAAEFEVRSFTRSWDNRGYLTTLGSPWISPRSISSKLFNGLLFGWTLWM